MREQVGEWEVKMGSGGRGGAGDKQPRKQHGAVGST